MALRDKLNNGTLLLQDSITKATEELKTSLLLPNNTPLLNDTQKSVYADILTNIKNNFQDPFLKDYNNKVVSHLTNLTSNNVNKNENINQGTIHTQPAGVETPIVVRSKRAAPFVYEPYKIIREGQAQESKKTTTTGNISPLIKQLQSSKVVEKVLSFNNDKDQPVKRNVKSRNYKDISRKDREQNIKRMILLSLIQTQINVEANQDMSLALLTISHIIVQSITRKPCLLKIMNHKQILQ